MVSDSAAAKRVALVLGASGYVGGRLVPRLLERGFAVRCLARDPGKLGGRLWSDDVEMVAGDLLDAAAARAFTGADVVFHLAHPPRNGDAVRRADRTVARNVVAAAEEAGTGRIVYLAGLGDTHVGQILLSSTVPVTILRTGMIIGSGGASFEMLCHLVETLPVVVAPQCARSRVQPIAIDDVLRYLVGVSDDHTDHDHVFDIGGPEVLTYQEMMQRCAAVAGVARRPIITVPLLSPALWSAWVSLVTPVPYAVVRPLVLSLSTGTLPRADAEDIAVLVPGQCLGFDEALRAALDRTRDGDVDTSWRDADSGDRVPADPYAGGPESSGGNMMVDVRTADTWATTQHVFAAVTPVGGERGWPSFALLWKVRGLLDRVVGGVGLRRGRRDPDRLRVGDAVDFWRVEDVRPPADESASGLLRLRAEMRIPGRAWLEWRMAPTPTGCRLTQRALYVPHGLLGRLYWWAMTPFHPPIFRSMVSALARDAESLAQEDASRAWSTSSGAPTAPPAARAADGGAPDPAPRRSRPAG